MFLAIDAGNTNIVFAIYDGPTLQGIWRCKTDSGRTADEYLAFLTQHFELKETNLVDIKDILICSVVPGVNFALSQLARKGFGVEPQFIKAPEMMKLGLEINVDRPHEVGADRLVNAFAIKNLFQAPAVVVDFGTATTFDVVDGKNVFRGGVIAPGINLSLEALHMAAATLPRITVAKPERAIGRNTVEAM